MMIYDYITPEGRELKPKRGRLPKAKVTVRFLTEEERKDYGCDDIVVVKKRCGCCHKVKSDYEFFPDTKSADGLSSWCRKCAGKAGFRLDEDEAPFWYET